VWLQALGAAGLAGGMATLVISLAHNRFFSPVVRVQAERGHRVVTSGPYALVRHPGYAAALLMLPSAALTLGSHWSALPLAVVALLIVRRAAIEDAFLLRELDGYSAYAARVRYRLVPFLW
jgi:protein-S-isoprenylcysteine O-methyltransferase Ste14